MPCETVFEGEAYDNPSRDYFRFLPLVSQLSSSAVMARRAESKEEAVEEPVRGEVSPPIEDVGGSARPWGLVLPKARTYLVLGNAGPEVRLAAALRSLRNRSESLSQ